MTFEPELNDVIINDIFKSPLIIESLHFQSINVFIDLIGSSNMMTTIGINEKNKILVELNYIEKDGD